MEKRGKVILRTAAAIALLALLMLTAAKTFTLSQVARTWIIMGSLLGIAYCISEGTFHKTCRAAQETCKTMSAAWKEFFLEIGCAIGLFIIGGNVLKKVLTLSASLPNPNYISDPAVAVEQMKQVSISLAAVLVIGYLAVLVVYIITKSYAWFSATNITPTKDKFMKFVQVNILWLTAWLIILGVAQVAVKPSIVPWVTMLLIVVYIITTTITQHEAIQGKKILQSFSSGIKSITNPRWFTALLIAAVTALAWSTIFAPIRPLGTQEEGYLFYTTVIIAPLIVWFRRFIVTLRAEFEEVRAQKMQETKSSVTKSTGKNTTEKEKPRRSSKKKPSKKSKKKQAKKLDSLLNQI